MTSAAARPALPIWQTVRQAFATLAEHWLAIVRILGTWLALIVAIGVLVHSHGLPLPGEMPLPNEASGQLFLLWLLMLGGGMLFISSTAVAWHRLLLLEEQPPAIYLGINETVLRYLGRCLLIGLILIPVMAVCVLLMGAVTQTLVPPQRMFFAPPSAGDFLAVLAAVVAGVIVWMPMLLVGMRLCIALPAIAIGRRMTLSESWRITEGNTGALLGGGVLILALTQAVGVALFFATWADFQKLAAHMLALASNPRSEALLRQVQALRFQYLLVMLVPSMLMQLATTVAGIGFLSLSYQALVGTGEPEQSEAG
jgi:hypothetical protein